MTHGTRRTTHGAGHTTEGETQIVPFIHLKLVPENKITKKGLSQIGISLIFYSEYLDFIRFESIPEIPLHSFEKYSFSASSRYPIL
jgi:hypothetical protein